MTTVQPLGPFLYEFKDGVAKQPLAVLNLMPALPNLVAWFDALDTSTMLSGNGSVITDGGAVALWGDKSGNSGVNCLVLPGSSGNYASVPDSAALSIAGNMDVVALLSCPDWTPAAAGTILAKRVATANQRTWNLGIETSGALSFGASSDGTTVNTAISSASPTVADFAKLWVKVEFKSNDGGVATATFYTAAYSTNSIPTSWTQLGAKQNFASTVTLYDGTAPIEFGSFSAGTGNLLACNIFRAAIYDGTGGTKVLDVDFSLAAKKLANGDTFTCATGQTVTLNLSGATGARIAGERDLFQGTLANRPVYLQYAGTKYGWLNAISGNSFTCPTVALTGDLDIQADIALADWSPSAAQGIVSKFGAAGNRGFRFEIGTTGLLTFVWSSDGTAFTAVAASEAIVLADGARKRVRCILDVDDGGVYTIKFFQSDNGSTWTQVGTTTTGGATTSIFNSTALLEVGQYAQANTPAGGKFYSASVSATIPADPLTDSGTPLRLFNPALYQSGTTFTASTGEVWTINGGAHIVTRTGLYFPGATQYLKSPTFSLSQPETVYFVGSQISWTVNRTLFDGGVNLSGAAIQSGTTPTLAAYSDPGTTVTNSNLPVATGGLITQAVGTGSVSMRINRGATASASGTTTAPNGFTLASRGAGASQLANTFVSEVAIYAAAHTTATQDRMALYAGRKWGFSVT